jgi:GABA(A) receptor-associated protein
MDNNIPFDKRLIESIRLREKYPDRVPVVICKAIGSDIQDINKKKYLVPNYHTIGQLVYLIRKRIHLNHENAIFVFVNNVLPPTSEHLFSVYDRCKDDDGFLYITYSGESVFGKMIKKK